MRHLRWAILVGGLGVAALLGGCVIAPPAFPVAVYPGYGEAAVTVQPAPVLIAPPVSLSIGLGGYYGGGYWRGGPRFWGRGRWR